MCEYQRPSANEGANCVGAVVPKSGGNLIADDVAASWYPCEWEHFAFFRTRRSQVQVQHQVVYWMDSAGCSSLASHCL